MPKLSVENFTDKTIKPCFLIRNFLSKDACEELLIQAESNMGFTEAHDKYPKSYRTNQRCWEDNIELAKHFSRRLLLKKAKLKAFSSIFQDYCGLNERLRYCKYNPGEVFNNHLDGHFFGEGNVESKLTFLLYLNEGYSGGETQFYSDKDKTELLLSHKGCVGDVLVFDHDIWHEGCQIESGVKYILRSDLLFNTAGITNDHLGYVWSMDNTTEYLLTTGRDQTIKTWGKGLKPLHEGSYHQASVLKVLAGGKYVFSTGRDGLICKADSDLTLISQIDSGHTTGLDLALVGEKLISAGSDGFMRSWTKELSLLSEVKAHHGWCWRVHVIENKWIVSVGEDGYLKRWDINFNLMDVIQLKNRALRCLDYVNGWILIGTEDGVILKVSLKEKGLVYSKKVHKGIVRDVKIVSGFVYSVGEDRKAYKTTLDLCTSSQIYEGRNFLTCLNLFDHELLVSGYEGKISTLP